MLKQAAMLVLGLLAMAEVVAGSDKLATDSGWTARQPLSLPKLAADVPASAAACVVVGHHVLADGSIADARIMQGAYVGGMDARRQKEFAASVLEVAGSWRFDAAGSGHTGPGFHVQTIGLVPAGQGGQRVVTDIDALPEALHTACRIEDLAAWGESHAVSVEQARAAHGDQVLVEDAVAGETYWVYREPLRRPVFPVDALRAEARACVVVGLVVEEDGVPSNALLLKSQVKTNHGRNSRIRKQLEDSAIAAAASSRFAPGPDNLERWAAIVQVPIGYVVEDAPHGYTREREENSQDALRNADQAECAVLDKQELLDILKD